MKKVFAISLIFAFLFNLTGCFLMLQVQHYRIRKAMIENIQRGIPESRVSKITVAFENRDKLEWEGEEEFKFEGMWYDMIQKEYLPDRSVRYYCIADHRDTNLFSKIALLIKKRQDAGKTGKIPVKTFYKLQIIHPSGEQNAWSPLFGENQSHTFSYVLSYTSPKLRSEIPPPKMC